MENYQVPTKQELIYGLIREIENLDVRIKEKKQEAENTLNNHEKWLSVQSEVRILVASRSKKKLKIRYLDSGFPILGVCDNIGVGANLINQPR